MYNSAKVAERIKSLAKEKKIRLRDLTEQAGVGVNTLSKMAKGDNVTIQTISKMADALGVSLSYLLEGRESPAPEDRDGEYRDIIESLRRMTQENRDDVREYVHFLESKAKDREDRQG